MPQKAIAPAAAQMFAPVSRVLSVESGKNGMHNAAPTKNDMQVRGKALASGLDMNRSTTHICAPNAIAHKTERISPSGRVDDELFTVAEVGLQRSQDPARAIATLGQTIAWGRRWVKRPRTGTTRT